MSELKVVQATLDIEMFVTCPNDECEFYINLLDSKDTNNIDHNEEGYLLRQMFPGDGDHVDFECEDVTCSKCKTVFNVKELEW